MSYCNYYEKLSKRGRPLSRHQLLALAIELNMVFGWNLLPIGIYKTPLRRWLPFQQSPMGEDDIRQLFTFCKSPAGIAVVHGPVSGGLCIRDFDTDESYEDWAAAHPKLAKHLPTVRTGRGYHVYFRALGTFDKLVDGEFRGTGGQYTLVPPSYHLSKSFTYFWTVPPRNDTIPYVDDVIRSGLLQPGISLKPPARTITSHHDSINTPAIERTPDTDTTYYVAPSKTIAEVYIPSRMIQDRIVGCVPHKIGERNSCILGLYRAVKGYRDDWSDVELAGIFKTWWGWSEPTVGTKDIQVSWRDFWGVYQRCRFTPALRKEWDWDEVTEESLREALPPVKPRRYTSRMQGVIRLFSCMNRRVNGDTFFIVV